MTREEAINIMKVIVHMLEEKYDTDRVEDAVDMAIKALEQDPCGDAISRQAVLDKKELVELEDGQSFYCISPEDVETLPPVIPQPKIGHWIEHPHEAGPCWEYSRYECSECHEWAEDDSDYCPDCGAKMESEE